MWFGWFCDVYLCDTLRLTIDEFVDDLCDVNGYNVDVYMCLWLYWCWWIYVFVNVWNVDEYMCSSQLR
jgi:hypothetical protein